MDDFDDNFGLFMITLRKVNEFNSITNVIIVTYILVLVQDGPRNCT